MGEESNEIIRRWKFL